MCSNTVLEFTKSDSYVFVCQELVAEENTKFLLFTIAF